MWTVQWKRRRSWQTKHFDSTKNGRNSFVHEWKGKLGQNDAKTKIRIGKHFVGKLKRNWTIEKVQFCFVKTSRWVFCSLRITKVTNFYVKPIINVILKYLVWV